MVQLELALELPLSLFIADVGLGYTAEGGWCSRSWSALDFVLGLVDCVCRRKMTEALTRIGVLARRYLFLNPIRVALLIRRFHQLQKRSPAISLILSFSLKLVGVVREYRRVYRDLMFLAIYSQGETGDSLHEDDLAILCHRCLHHADLNAGGRKLAGTSAKVNHGCQLELTFQQAPAIRPRIDQLMEAGPEGMDRAWKAQPARAGSVPTRPEPRTWNPVVVESAIYTLPARSTAEY